MRRLALLLATATLLHAQSPLIWFCPLDPLLRPEVGYGGSPQYLQLFTPDAPWTQAASRVNVFKIYPQWISAASDADLQLQFADLHRRGIALALEWGMLTASDACGRGVEGFGGQATLNAVRRIQRLGGDLQYVAMDEPIYFGTLYKGTNACRWTLDQMAQNAAANIAALHAEFPNIAVGDIEPLPVDETDRNWLDQYARGIDALQTATGAPLAFFHSDIAWFSNTWPASIAAMRKAVQDRGLPFGVIYNGDDSNQSDASWIAAAEAHMTTYESAADPPDHVIFQSWNAFPRTLLPETEPAAFTNLINRYFRARTQLTASAGPDGLSGQLTTTDATPVPGASISVTATPLTGSGTEAQYTFEGVTPAGAQQIVLGLRVNLECGCSAPSDFRLRGFSLASGDLNITRDFSAGLNGWGLSDRSLAAIEDGQLHVHATADQPLLLNSPSIAFPAENQPFKFTVTATVSPASAGSGYFTVIFLNGRELTRARIPIAAQDQDLGTATTADDGTFQLPIPQLAPAGYRLRAVFPGDQNLWPAQADVTLNPQPARSPGRSSPAVHKR